MVFSDMDPSSVQGDSPCFTCYFSCDLKVILLVFAAGKCKSLTEKVEISWPCVIWSLDMCCVGTLAMLATDQHFFI